MAMNMDAALTLRAKVEGANSIVDFNRTLTGVESSAKHVTGALQGMTGAAGGLSGALGALAPLLSVAGLVEMAKGALDAGQEMLHMSEKTGVSVEQLAKFKKAAALTNTDLETVGKSIVKLDKAMVDAFANGKSAKWFDVLGISVKNASGKLRDSNAVMLEVANRFHEMPDGAAKTAIALGLFGKAGAEMIPMLDMGGDAISRLQTKMTAAFAEKADDYKKRLAALGGQIQALGMDLAEALLPALEKITVAVTSGVQAFNKLPGPIKELAVGGALLAIAWGPLTALISGSVGLFTAVTAAIEGFQLQLALASMEGIPAFSAALMSVPIIGWAAALATLGVLLYQNNQAFRDWANNVVSVVSNDFHNAMQEVAYDSQSAFKIAQNAMQGLAKAAKPITDSLVQDFGWAFRTIAQKAQEAFGYVTQTILGWWNNLPAPVRAGLGNATRNTLMMLPAGYAGSVYFRAFTQKSGSSAPNSNGGENGAVGETPNLSALGKAPNLGKLDTASIDEAATLKTEIALLQAQIQKEEVQKQINALTIEENGLRDAGNIQGAIAVQQQISQKQYSEDRAKILADMSAGLQKNAEITKQANREEEDQKVKLTAVLELRKLDNKFAQETALHVQAAAKAEHDRALAQRNALEDIDNRNRYSVLGATQGATVEQRTREIEALQRQIKDTQSIEGYSQQSIDDLLERIAKLKQSFAEADSLGRDALYGISKGSQDYINSIGTLADGIGRATSNTLKGMEDALVNFVTTGKMNFKELADAAVKELARIVIEQAIVGPIAKGLGGLFHFADGGIMTSTGSMPLHKYASGGIASSPQLAMFGEGTTPEAYVPLPDGRRIPVAMKGGGGGGNIINVSVDASGSSISGNAGQGATLGRMIAASVQTELIRQRRPGGILAAA